MSLTIRDGGVVPIVDGPVDHRDLSRNVVGVVHRVASDAHSERVGHPRSDILEVVLKRSRNGIGCIAHCSEEAISGAGQR